QPVYNVGTRAWLPRATACNYCSANPRCHRVCSTKGTSPALPAAKTRAACNTRLRGL
ncbi:hypothetical protein LPJ81_006700, partial [Coemansia sp. IMI 209127]